MWAELGQALEVALFCRTLAEAERADARADIKKMVRGYLDSLGLSVSGMLRNRWKIAPAAEVAALEAAAGGERAPRRRSARDRLKVVRSGAGSGRRARRRRRLPHPVDRPGLSRGALPGAGRVPAGRGPRAGPVAAAAHGQPVT